MNIWRVAGVALMAGLALFLVSLLLKLLLIAVAAVATVLLVKVVGGRLAGRFFGPLERGNWSSTDIISIDNPAYRSPVRRAGFERIVPIS